MASLCIERTVCPGPFDQIYVVSYYVKCDKTSWIDSTGCLLDVHDLLVQVEADGVTDDLLQLVVLTVNMLLHVLISVVKMFAVQLQKVKMNIMRSISRTL